MFSLQLQYFCLYFWDHIDGDYVRSPFFHAFFMFPYAILHLFKPLCSCNCSFMITKQLFFMFCSFGWENLTLFFDLGKLRLRFIYFLLVLFTVLNEIKPFELLFADVQQCSSFILQCLYLFFKRANSVFFGHYSCFVMHVLVLTLY